MAQSAKGELNYRCPMCLKRDLDLDLAYDKDKKEYYCYRCAFHGTEKDVLRLNEQFKEKYGRLKERVVDFGEDNEPPKFKPHKSGEQ